MAVATRFRDIFSKYVPPWLSDRVSSNLITGYSYLWSMIAPLDAAMEVLTQGLRAAWPGVGTPTALPLIGRMRGIIRGQGELDADYVETLRPWLDRWRTAGSMDAIAYSIHRYLSGHPRVSVVNRAGYWVQIDTSGVVTRHQTAWDWDSVSNPERAGYWSEIWVMVDAEPWPRPSPKLIGDPGLTFGSPLGIGHDVGRVDYDAILGLVAQWKAAHTRVRAIIFCADPALFDPTAPLSLPDGTWGMWGDGDNTTRVLGGRNLTDCSYWEPR